MKIFLHKIFYSRIKQNFFLQILLFLILLCSNFSSVFSQTSFPCQSGFFQISEDRFLKYDGVNQTYNQISFVPYGTNAYGYNPKDGFIYGINHQRIIKLKPDGSWEYPFLNNIPGYSIDANSGDFDENGYLYVTTRIGSSLCKIDIASNTLLSIIPMKIGSTYFTSSRSDIVFNPTTGKFYTISNRRLYEISKDGTVVDKGPLPALYGYVPNGGFGSLWITKEGYLFAFHNGSGYIYKIRISDVSVPGFYKVHTSYRNDGAGCPNQYAPVDTDRDTHLDYADDDADGDGICNTQENGGINPFSNGQNADNYLDTDNDKIPNFLDLDSDNDGIPDNIEAQTTLAYTPPSGTVAANGVDIAYGSNGLSAIDTDSDNTADYLDTDSDDDGVDDVDESLLDYVERSWTVDDDKDGILDQYDCDPTTYGTPNQKMNSTVDLRNQYISVPGGELYFRLGLAYQKRPPVANPDPISVKVNLVKRLKNDFNYSDPDNDPFTGVRIYSVSEGNLFVDRNANGKFDVGEQKIAPVSGNPTDILTLADLNLLSYMSANVSPSASFPTKIEFKVYDGEAFSIKKYILDITITNEANEPPVINGILDANNILATINEDTQYTFTFSDLLAKTDIDDVDDLTSGFIIKSVTNGSILPANGIVNATTNVVFTPTTNFASDSGSDVIVNFVATDPQNLESNQVAGKIVVNRTGVNALTDSNTAQANEVSENALVGTTLGLTAFATDGDGDAVTYSLSDDFHGWFTIDPSTGVVSVAGNVDYESGLLTNHKATVEVTATSADGS
ncbi:DUF6923 family protein, partial [Marinifilum sp. D737]|uniref:DUF6923 family protein n=1 Tax=Marinifilum sp. D737 TaxID=2969628 RepID=UPI002274A609